MNKLIDKLRNMPVPMKATICFMFCNILLKGISFFTAPMFARLLSDTEYGKMSIFMTYEQLFVVLATWEVALGAYQKGLFKYKDQREKFTTVVILFSNFITICFAALILGGARYVLHFTEMSYMTLIVLLVYIFFYPAYQCWMTRTRVDYEYVKTCIMNVSLSILQVVVPLCAVVYVGANADTKVIATLMPAAILFLVIYCKELKISKLFHQDDIIDQVKFIFSFSAPLVLHSLSYLILAQADRVMIGKIEGDDKAAIYSVAYTIATVIMIVQNSLSQAIVPWIFQNLEQKNYKNIRDRIHSILYVLCAIYLMFILVAPDVIIFLFPENYHEGIWCIPPITWGVFFMFFYSIFVNIEEYYEDTRYIAAVSIFCSVLNVGLNYIGIHQFGYIACAYTTLICYIIFAIGHYYFMNKIMKKNDVKDKIFNPVFFIKISAIMFASSAVLMLVYEKMIIRYSLVCAILVLCALFRKKIFEVIRRQ